MRYFCRIALILYTAVPRIAMANETLKMAFIITEKAWRNFALRTVQTGNFNAPKV